MPVIPFSKRWLDRAKRKGADEDTSWSKASILKTGVDSGDAMKLPGSSHQVLTVAFEGLPGVSSSCLVNSPCSSGHIPG